MKAAATLAFKALSLALGGALTTSVVSAMASAAPAPVAPRTLPTSYQQVPLGAAATWPLTGTYANPPMGTPTLGGVPFTTSNILLLTGGTRTDYTLATNKPLSVSLLVNSAYGFSSYQGQTVGKVHLTFGDGTAQDANIVGGSEVREWWLGSGLLTTLTDPSARQVWQGNGAADTGIGSATAVMDMLTVKVKATHARLTGVSVLNTATAPFDLLLSGVTVAYQTKTAHDEDGNGKSKKDGAGDKDHDSDKNKPHTDSEEGQHNGHLGAD